jgi:hypothetical protein
MDVWVSLGVLGRWEIQITNGKKWGPLTYTHSLIRKKIFIFIWENDMVKI